MTDLLQRAPGLVAGRPPLRYRRFSGVWRPRMVAVTLAGVVLTAFMTVVNISRGDFPIAFGEAVAVLLGGGEGAQQFIVLDLRLPRTLTAVLVGAALGLSGAITQTVARNPLASPDVLGVTAGASTAAVIVIVLGGSFPLVASVSDLIGLPLAALLTAVIVYGLSWRRGIEGYRLVLVGVGIGAVAEALTAWMLVYADITDAARATVWLTGSLNARGWEHVIPVATALAVLVPIGLLLAFGLGALQLGDDTARSLGVRVDRARSALLLTAVGLAAVATASAGPIAFVALVVPQVCLRLVGSGRPPLVASTVYGALLLLTSDVIGRTTLPVELPVGIITAILGAPYLIWLLVRGNGRDRT